jgi:hypothetical protein
VPARLSQQTDAMTPLRRHGGSGHYPVEMGPFRSKWWRALLLWTLTMVIVAIALAVFAAASLVDAQQRCFMEFPSVPCPDGQDWRAGLLAFAFLGVPLIWLVGVIVGFAGRSVSKERRARHR